jgi:thiol-disulfide isomerase/thioredoxin
MPRRFVGQGAFVLGMSVSLMLTGCGKQHSDADLKPSKASTELQSETKSAPIPVAVVGKDEYQKAVAAHQGKVVLVDYWATWCGPCVKQFPHTVELAKKYHDRGLDVIALSFDEPGDVENVQKFLAEKGATFENLISKVGANETSADEFDFDGALPSYAVYGRDGKLVKRISPSDPTIPFRPELIDEAIEEQLTLPAP